MLHRCQYDLAVGLEGLVGILEGGAVMLHRCQYDLAVGLEGLGGILRGRGRHCFTAASTISRSALRALAAYLRAGPSCFTAASTISRSALRALAA